MSDEKSLTVIEQREVVFYGDELTAFRVEDGTVYVPIRPICERLGVDWSSQRQRIHRDAVLSKHFVVVTTTKSGRGNPNMAALPLDYLNGWLFGINASRVSPDIHDRLVRYQEECYRVLAEVFQQQRVTAAPTVQDMDMDELLRTGDTPEAQAYRMALAIANIARQQLIFRYQLEEQAGRLDAHEQRLEMIEATLGDPARYITAAQAGRISQAVKAIALELGKRSGRNEFGGVYGELYRRFDIAGYRELPAGKYEEALRFLGQWYGSLTGGELPF